MMYSIFVNNQPVKTFKSKENADWAAYSMQRRGIPASVTPAPSVCIIDLLNDLEGLELSAAALITINGAQVWA